MITKRIFGGGALAVALLWGPRASAQPGGDVTRADALFKEAMQLHGAGRDAEACPKFAESKQIAPGVGVTLYLADCYEHTGRNASAWREFRDAETLARARNDKRADVAAQRAAALEPRLNRLTIAAPASEAGADVLLDGAPVPPSYWNAGLAVDSGDHLVTVTSAGQAPLSYPVHVDASEISTVVRIGDSAAAAPTAAAAVPVVVANQPLAGGDAGVETAAKGSGIAGRAVGVGLMIAGAAGIGIGTWLVTDKTREMDNGQLCEPHLRKGAIPGGVVAFSAGGVALISGIVVYYVNRPGSHAVSLGPAVLPGGGGAMFRATF